MKRSGSPLSNTKLHNRTRLLTALAAFCLLTFLMGATAFMQSRKSPVSALTGLSSDAALVGEVSVTATAGTTGPTPYTTLKGAFDAINAGTHQGAITIDITASTVEGATPAVLNSSGAGSASYTSVLIRPTSDGVTVAGTTPTGRGVIELNGADNVTIDGDNPNTAGTNRNLTIQSTATSTTAFTSMVRIALATSVVTSADNNTIKNLNLVGNATGRNVAGATSTTGSENTVYGVLATAGASTTVATNAPAAVSSVATTIGSPATASNLLIDNNSVATCARGIAVQGSATTVFPGLTISNNTVGNATASAVDQVYSVGITAQGSANGAVRQNTVYIESFLPSSTSSANRAIDIGGISATGTFTVERNQVNRAKNNAPDFWLAHGINIAGGTNSVVRNNFIQNLTLNTTSGGFYSTTFNVAGIRLAGGTGHQVYHNSVNLTGTITGATPTITAGLMITATTITGVDARNNILVNSLTNGSATSAHVAVYLPPSGTAAMNLTLNNNDYFNSAAPTATQGVGQVGTTAGTGFFTQANFDPTMTTPATNFRSYTSTLSAGGANDNATKKVDPQFLSATDLHIAAASPMVDMGATVGVGTDIDGQARVGVPDIGADEPGGVTPAMNDIAAVAIVNPPSGSTRGAGIPFTVQASFTNNGTAAQGSVPVRFKIIDSSMTTVYNMTTNVAINPGQTVVATFPNATLIAGAYTTMASSELPGDEAPANDSVSGTVNVVDPVAGGTYTVGTGGNYTSLTNAGGIFEALNVAGASGNIVLNITSDLTGETGANALNAIGGGFTLTIKPSGAARTISGTSSTTGLIKLNGADNVTIDGSLSGGTDRSLTITNGNAGATVIWIASASAADGANGNTVKNCILSGNAGTTIISGVLAGSGTTFGGDAETANSNNTIQNNRVFRVQNAAFIRGSGAALDQNWLVTGNDLGSTVAADKLIFRGMLIGNAQNFTVSNNTISGISSTTTTSSTMSGIQVALVVNGGAVTGNKISDIKHNNTTGWGSNGIYITSSSANSNVLVANNFISDVASQGFNGQADTDNGYGIVVALGGGYKIYHNSVLLNTNQGAGAAAGQTAAVNILTGLAAGAVDLRDNAFASTQTLGTRFGVICNSANTVFSSINYNDYFAQNVGFIGGSARPTLANWQTGTGQDANSLAADPLFATSTAPADLHLQAASTLINAGTTVAGVTTDIDGQTRDAMPDIGADEVSAAVNLSIADASTVEADVEVHSISVAVTLSSAPAQPVTVHWATAPGTATAATDYATASGDLIFNQGQITQEIHVDIIEETIDEGNETFFINLSMPNGAAISDGQNLVTIIDDDVNTGDFDNDGRNDPSVFRPNADDTHTAKWFVLNSNGCCNDRAAGGGGLVTEIQFGAETDIPASGDYDGNGSKDIAVYRPNDDGMGSSAFYVLNNPPVGFIKIVWGANGDIPVPGDYDGDLKTDAAVFRPSEGNWYVRKSSDGSLLVQQWGLATDRLVPSDYDADGKTDFAVVRDDVPAAGSATWYIRKSSDGSVVAQQWGFNTDKLVPADYDVDGKTDVAVWRPSDGTFYVLRSSNGALQAQQWGMMGDVPVVGDYDGDSIVDYAVWRPSNGIYFILKSSDGNYIGPIWGLPGDVPIASRYVPEQ